MSIGLRVGNGDRVLWFCGMALGAKGICMDTCMAWYGMVWIQELEGALRWMHGMHCKLVEGLFFLLRLVLAF
jgi:hypothetical protein